MVTVIWLIVWLLSETPQVAMWNAWAVGLIVCIVLDVLHLLDGDDKPPKEIHHYHATCRRHAKTDCTICIKHDA